jgi:hypothetical protein
MKKQVILASTSRLFKVRASSVKAVAPIGVKKRKPRAKKVSK